MLVKEVNDAGGVLGRPIKLLVRDVKGSPEEATRVAKEMILKDNVEFLVGGLTSSQGLALSEVSKQEEILYIAPISKVAAMNRPPTLKPKGAAVRCWPVIRGGTGSPPSDRITPMDTASPELLYPG
jgi:branched-chain amino acid transport system substrate-binding protein